MMAKGYPLNQGEKKMENRDWFDLISFILSMACIIEIKKTQPFTSQIHKISWVERAHKFH